MRGAYSMLSFECNETRTDCIMTTNGKRYPCFHFQLLLPELNLHYIIIIITCVAKQNTVLMTKLVKSAVAVVQSPIIRDQANTIGT